MYDTNKYRRNDEKKSVFSSHHCSWYRQEFSMVAEVDWGKRILVVVNIMQLLNKYKGKYDFLLIENQVDPYLTSCSWVACLVVVGRTTLHQHYGIPVWNEWENSADLNGGPLLSLVSLSYDNPKWITYKQKNILNSGGCNSKIKV